ncbi:MAG: FkbM family methyltransferase, partial [Planctomycetaceae bacterium]|nr:FkbM family methyltransferase [Planctomycetaceae bacterium]
MSLQLTGRMREIAMGRSGLSRSEVEKYRALFQQQGFTLPPLDFANSSHARAGCASCGGTTNRVDVCKSYSSGVGTRLKELIDREFPGTSTCDACQSSVLELNQLLPRQVQVRKSQFIDEILSRADRAPLLHRALVALDQAVTGNYFARRKLRQLLDEAVEGAQPVLAAGPVEHRTGDWSPTRHLVFHVYPVGELWKWNLDELLRHWSIFDGRKVIGIVHDSSSATPEEVQEYLSGRNCEWVVKSNVPMGKPYCCESQTFYEMVDLLGGEDDLVYYAHAKGVTSRQASAEIARRWVTEMHHACLDRCDEAFDELRYHGAYGAFLTDHRPRPVISGTFFWFRLGDALRRNWRKLRSGYPAIEQWPTDVFPDNVGCRFDLRNDARISALYSPDAWSLIESRVQRETDVQRMAACSPAPAWPAGFQNWPETIRHHRQLVQNAVAEAKETPYPDERYSGRGIVMPAGGWWRIGNPHQPYFWCAYAAAFVIRRLGSQLPIQFWFLPGEMAAIPDAEAFAARVGATCHTIPDGEMRCPHGWQVKIQAILRCPFEEVIHLDSDVICEIDPARLFDEPGYIEHGVMFWADNPDLRGHMEKCSYILPDTWRRLGEPSRGRMRDIEAGQMVIDKRRAWHALLVDRHLADHADYWGGFNGGESGVWYGDKTDHHVACILTGTPYQRDDRFEFDRSGGCYVHRGRNGEVLLRHCCDVKGHLVNGDRIPNMAAVSADSIVEAKLLRGIVPWLAADNPDLIEESLKLISPERYFQFPVELKEYTRRTWLDVVAANEYRLTWMSAKNVVLDIGANVGAASYQCARMGAGRILAFEPFPECVRLARQNLKQFPHVELREAAVWRSDQKTTSISLHPHGHPEFTQGYSTTLVRSVDYS